MDISSTRDLGHRRLVRGSVLHDLQNICASYFIGKDENSLSHRRSSKYDAGQERQTGVPESSDVRSGEILKLHARERRTVTGRDRRG